MVEIFEIIFCYSCDNLFYFFLRLECKRKSHVMFQFDFMSALLNMSPFSFKMSPMVVIPLSTHLLIELLIKSQYQEMRVFLSILSMI